MSYKKQLSSETAVVFESSKAFDSPYFHYRVESFFAPEVAAELLQWLNQTEMYRTVEGGFYKQTMFPIMSATLPSHLQYVFDQNNRSLIKQHAEQMFETEFEDQFMVTTHRLTNGEQTFIHNDYLDDPRNMKYGFTHRLIVYLNEHWDQQDGGTLGIYASEDTADLVYEYEPTHNTAVGLAFSPNSYHDVKKVTGGDRYTINFSFLSKQPNYKI